MAHRTVSNRELNKLSSLPPNRRRQKKKKKVKNKEPLMIKIVNNKDIIPPPNPKYNISTFLRSLGSYTVRLLLFELSLEEWLHPEIILYRLYVKYVWVNDTKEEIMARDENDIPDHEEHLDMIRNALNQVGIESGMVVRNDKGEYKIHPLARAYIWGINSITEEYIKEMKEIEQKKVQTYTLGGFKELQNKLNESESLDVEDGGNDIENIEEEDSTPDDDDNTIEELQDIVNKIITTKETTTDQDTDPNTKKDTDQDTGQNKD